MSGPWRSQIGLTKARLVGYLNEVDKQIVKQQFDASLGREETTDALESQNGLIIHNLDRIKNAIKHLEEIHAKWLDYINNLKGPKLKQERNVYGKTATGGGKFLEKMDDAREKIDVLEAKKRENRRLLRTLYGRNGGFAAASPRTFAAVQNEVEGRTELEHGHKNKLLLVALITVLISIGISLFLLTNPYIAKGYYAGPKLNPVEGYKGRIQWLFTAYFPTQDQLSRQTVYQAGKDFLNRTYDKPVVILIVGRNTEVKFFSHFFAEIILNQSPDPYINASSLARRDFESKLESQLNSTHIAEIHGIEHLNADAPLALKRFSDEQYAPIPHSLLILTVFDDEFAMQTSHCKQQITEYLTSKWSGLQLGLQDGDTIPPIISRIITRLVCLQPEFAIRQC